MKITKFKKHAQVPPEDPQEAEDAYEEERMHEDPTTGKKIHYIRRQDVERVLDNFIVDTLTGATMSKRFSLEFGKKSGELRSLSGMRMVNHPYSRYNLDSELRKGILGAIKDYNVGDLQEILEINNAESLKREPTKRSKRWYNPNRSRRTRYPVTRMQEIRDMHGMVGIYDLAKARKIATDITTNFGEYFSHRELDLLKSVALTNAYVNIYPHSVDVIRGNGKIWVVDDDTYNNLAQKGVHPEFD
jgi:hypothetical protein